MRSESDRWMEGSISLHIRLRPGIGKGLSISIFTAFKDTDSFWLNGSLPPSHENGNYI